MPIFTVIILPIFRTTVTARWGARARAHSRRTDIERAWGCGSHPQARNIILSSHTIHSGLIYSSTTTLRSGDHLVDRVEEDRQALGSEIHLTSTN